MYKTVSPNVLFISECHMILSFSSMEYLGLEGSIMSIVSDVGEPDDSVIDELNVSHQEVVSFNANQSITFTSTPIKWYPQDM